MKKVLASLMAVGLMATAANAATVGLRWSDTPDQKHLGAGTVEVFISLLNGESVSGANGDFVCVSGDCSNLLFTNFQPGNAAGWEASNTGIGPHMGAPDFAGMNGGATNPLTDSVSGPTSFIMARFDVGFDGAPDLSEKGFAVAFPTNPGGGVINATAQAYKWDTRYNGSFAGYIAFDANFGNPGFAGKGGEPALGLLITKVPEPSSLALIALGGLAMLRRRR
jgi:hypothetical protein